MKNLFFFFGLLLFAVLANGQRNTILIIADDLSPDYFGFYEDHVDTVDVPNIRGLLNKGVRFSNAMSNPVCSSTRTGILTGRYSFRTGVGNIVGGTGGSGELDTAEVTIPRLLKQYNPSIATANIGKWHLHQPSPAAHLQYPNLMGYDHFEGPFIGQLPSFTNWTKYTNGVPGTVTNYATSENVDNAVSWVKAQNATSPFFLWLAFNAPHAPLHLPPAGLHTFTSLSGTQQDITQNPKSYFKAMIQALDTEIGRLFDSLQTINRLDSTDIIFIGDNGNTIRTAQIDNTDRAKGTIYQYGVHVPMIIAGPSIINPGRTSNALVNTADLFATILELFKDTMWQSNIPINKPVDSKSILPILHNQSNQIRPWSFCEMFKVTPDSADGKAMRNTDYKLIRFDYGQEEFYHLSADSLELNNLLNGTLTATELTNYNYLCNEMTNLVGVGATCNTGVGIIERKREDALSVCPNPFTSHIFVQSTNKNEHYVLTDCLGQTIYTGQHIETQDLSNLAHGIYFLRTLAKPTRAIKLMKE